MKDRIYSIILSFNQSVSKAGAIHELLFDSDLDL